MFETMGLKNEFQVSLRNYTVQVFQKGDLNKMRDLLIKYAYIEGSKKGDYFQVNQHDSITSLLSYLDIENCQKLGINPDTLQGIHKDKKARNKIIVQGEKKFCGIDKKILYKECILPVLLTVCESRNANIIDLISSIVQQIAEIEQGRDEDADMEQDDKQIESDPKN